jgi:hypothetical protein
MGTACVLLFKVLGVVVPSVIGGIAAVSASKDAKRLRDEAGDRGVVTKVISGRAFTREPDAPMRRAA